MKHQYCCLFTLTAALLLITACGPDKEEQQRQEQARQDSLEQVRQDSLKQQRQDSLAKVQAQNKEQTTGNAANVSLSENGRFAILVESWRSRLKAQTRAEKWKERGFKSVSVVQHGNEQTGNIWFRVRLGRINSRQDAEQLQESLQKEYQANSWISTI